jgi:putative FmdB family regulatory protein
MPTYVYQCSQCGYRFEARQHMTDDPLTTCPQCGGSIHRVLFPAGIVFKGNGFYSTDHRPSSNGTAASGSSAVAEKSSTTEASKTASKSSGTSTGGETKASDSTLAAKP